MADQAVSLPTIEDVRSTLNSCATFSLRKLSRLTTQIFDEALSSTGLRSTQLIILATLYLKEKARLSELARQLALSPSTLSRNLKPLERDGLVQTSLDTARRRKIVLTPTGVDLLQKCLPRWKAAQESLSDLVGVQFWKELSPLLHHCIQSIQMSDEAETSL